MKKEIPNLARIKIIVLGDKGVGKTSFVRRLHHQHNPGPIIDEKPIQHTIGCDVRVLIMSAQAEKSQRSHGIIDNSNNTSFVEYNNTSSERLDSHSSLDDDTEISANETSQCFIEFYDVGEEDATDGVALSGSSDSSSFRSLTEGNNITDSSGNPAKRILFQQEYQGVILVYDMCDHASLQDLQSHMRDMLAAASTNGIPVDNNQLPVLLVGTHADEYRRSLSSIRSSSKAFGMSSSPSLPLYSGATRGGGGGDPLANIGVRSSYASQMWWTRFLSLSWWRRYISRAFTSDRVVSSIVENQHNLLDQVEQLKREFNIVGHLQVNVKEGGPSSASDNESSITRLFLDKAIAQKQQQQQQAFRYDNTGWLGRIYGHSSSYSDTAASSRRRSIPSILTSSSSPGYYSPNIGLHAHRS